MKKFLLHIFLFTSLLLVSMLAVFYLADGHSDPYYLRFTSSRQSSLIIGSSRAAQGLQPSVFNEIIYKNGNRQFYNYAFSLIDSPFGPAYYESIEKKLDPQTKDGIFIIAVDPWSISAVNANPDDTMRFLEDKTFMGKTKYVNIDPNLFYLVNSYDEPYVNILRKWRSGTVLNLHKDGWLQVNIAPDSSAGAKSAEAKLEFYRKNYLPVYKFSASRMNYLSKTIDLLQKHGAVYLVRLPVLRAMFDMEHVLMPDFDDKMSDLARTKHIGYLNFKERENPYQYVDGHHLQQSSGKQVSALVAAWIQAGR